MKYTITYPTDFEEVNKLNDNIDVCLRLEDGREYTLVVATPDNLKYLMQKDQLPFVRPGLPFLFVEEITEENIRQLVEELIKEDYVFLRIYGGDLLSV